MYSECTECLHASRTCSRFCCSWMMINAVDICAMRSQLVALLDLIMCLAAPATMNSMSPVGTHAHMIGSTPLTVTSAGCGSAVFCCSCNPAVHAGMMDAEVALFFSRAAGDADAYNSDGSHAGEFIGPCHSCGFDLMLRQRDDQKFVVACTGAPSCKESVYLPRATLAVSVSEDHCQDCHHGIVHKLNLRYDNNCNVLVYCLIAATDRPNDATMPAVRHAW